MAKKKNRKRTQTGRRADPQSALPAAQAAPEVAEARRARQIREWEQRKKAKERGTMPVAVYAWAGGGIAVTAAVIVGIVLLLSGGSSDSTVAVVSSTPDPRLGGQAVAQTVEIDAGDAGQATGTYFALAGGSPGGPLTIEGKAGEVIEFKVKNVGSVAHNLVIAGTDGEYGTRDDWITDPGTIMPGETGILRVKLNAADSYPFHCEFHPDQQTGTLVLR